MAEQQLQSTTPPKMAAAELPFEIITEILSRLPVKPLHRFKTVSKKFKTLISSPKFIKRHLNQTLISSPIPKILLNSHESLISAPISATKLQFTKLNHPLKHLPGVGLIESYHGLILITAHSQTTLVLYNPTTNSHRFLPPPPTPLVSKPSRGVGLDDQYLGFGYDVVKDDFKVVRLLQWVVADDNGNPAVLYRETAVYSVRDDNWKLVNDGTIQAFLQESHAVTANEMLHYIAVKRDLTTVLKCFDLRTETFLLVDIPELDSRDFSKMSMSLRELRGCLCMLVDYQKHRVGPNAGVPLSEPLYNRQYLYSDVWELRERGRKESWVKVFRISHHDIVKCRMSLRLVTYSKDYKSVLLEVDGMWFGWYDLVRRKIKRVVIEGMLFEDAHSLALTFVESLVSVSTDKVVLKGRTMPPGKNKKDNFLSAGFKLKL